MKNKKKAIFGLILSVGFLLSVNSVKETTSAQAGWAIVSGMGADDGAPQVFAQAAGATLGGAGAAWAGAKIGGEIGAIVGGPIGLAIGAGLGAL